MVKAVEALALIKVNFVPEKLDLRVKAVLYGESFVLLLLK